MTRFKVLTGQGCGELEAALNQWAGTLPSGTRIRRTQLTATLAAHDEPDWLYALVNYELPPAAENP